VLVPNKDPVAAGCVAPNSPPVVLDEVPKRPPVVPVFAVGVPEIRELF